MPAEQKHPPPPQWRVNLHARSRNFSVELTATTPIPTWRPPDHHRVSFLLRLWSFVLRVQSNCGAVPPKQRRRFLKSIFLRALDRIRGSRAKKRAAVPTLEADKAEIGKIRPPIVLALISAFLLGAIAAHRLDKIGAGFAAAAAAILLGASKKSVAARQASLAVVLLSLLSMVQPWSRVLDLARYVDFTGDWARGILWKIWRSAAPRNLDRFDLMDRWKIR